jgi:hypothetical protein
MLLYRKFAIEYIPKLNEAVINNIFKSPESNIRNFSKEKIEAIVLLLKSIYLIKMS